MAKHSKGSQFEREVCTRLSKWWTENERDDIFWRSSGSGARATTRFKRGKKTAGQDGDISAIHPSGQKLMRIVTMELKRGYKGHTIHDLLDWPKNKPKTKLQAFEEFFGQAIRSHHSANSYAWALIVRRDFRDGWIWLSTHLYQHLQRHGAFHGMKTPYPLVTMECNIRGDHVTPGDCEFTGMMFDDFLFGCNRNHFEEVWKDIKKEYGK